MRKKLPAHSADLAAVSDRARRSTSQSPPPPRGGSERVTRHKINPAKAAFRATLAALLAALALCLTPTPRAHADATLFLDDFDGTALDFTRWTAPEGGGAAFVSCGLFQLSGPPDHKDFNTVATFAPPAGGSVRARARIRLGGDYQKFGFNVNYPNAGPTRGYYFDTYERGSTTATGFENRTHVLAWEVPASGPPVNLLDLDVPVTWYEFHEFAVERTASEVVFSIDGVEVGSVADSFAGALPAGVWNDRSQLMQADFVEVSRTDCVPPPSGMIAWWPGDNNALDIQGGNNGTLQNGATFAPGKVSQAFSFDGVDDYVRFGNTLGGLNGGFTLDAWVRTTATVGNKAIVAKYETTGGSWTIRTNESDPGKVDFTVCSPDCLTLADAVQLVSTSNINDGEWHFVAATFDGSTQRLYVDGALEASGTNTNPAWADNHYFCIGAFCDSSGNSYLPFGGLIDEVEVFNRALSATEIQSVFDAGDAGKCKPTPANCVPVVNAPPAVNATTGADATACGVIVPDSALGSATASDVCDGALAVTRSGVPDGNFFPVGTTHVSYSATDGAGHTTTATQDVTVADNTPPVIAGASPSTNEIVLDFNDGLFPSAHGWTFEGHDQSNQPILESQAASVSGGVLHLDTLPFGGAFAGNTLARWHKATTGIDPSNYEYEIRMRAVAPDASRNCFGGLLGAGMEARENYGFDLTLMPPQLSIAGFSPSPANDPCLVAPADGSAFHTYKVVVRNDTQATVFVDGVQTAQGTLTRLNTLPLEVLFGDLSTSGGNMTADIDYVRVASGAQNCAQPPPGMVSWWPGEDSASDARDGNNGTLRGGATFAAGRVGRAFSFDGASDYVSVPDSANLRLADTAFSISLWFNTPTLARADGQMLLSKGVSDSDEEYSILLTPEGKVYWDYGDTQAFVITNPGVVVPNHWTHLVVVYDAAATPKGKIYLDGVEQPLAFFGPVQPHIVSSGSDLYIGTQNAGSPYYPARVSFAGLVDEVMIFDRALSASEVQAVHSAGGGGVCAGDIHAEADAGSCSATVNVVEPAVTDNCLGATVAGVRSDGQPLDAPYPVGTTTITWTATDASGNAASATQTVAVTDAQAPSVTAPAVSPSVLWPPNHTMQGVTVSYDATDNCGGVTCVISSVTSNEPVNGTGDGDTAPDWLIVDGHRVQLRAERAGGGNGRVYTITVRCTDDAGNATTKTVTVTVPKSQK